MPNGNLIIEGGKEIAVNSERQVVWLRGVVRPADLSPENFVASSRIALMDLRVNGRGVVNDALAFGPSERQASSRRPITNGGRQRGK
jgi:flagellar L-ring protein precursor FlgH